MVKIDRFVVSEDPTAWLCPFYKCPLETSTHIFLECDLARILWRSFPWPISFLAYSTGSISNWVIDILSLVAAFGIPKYDVRKFQLFIALMLDLVWRCKNLLVCSPLPLKPFIKFLAALNSILQLGTILLFLSCGCRQLLVGLKGTLMLQ